MAPKANRAARSTSAAQLVKALVPVEYNHTRHEPGGEPFEVDAEDVDQLLEVNAVELTGGEAAAT
ncbi:hypothetical protein [Rhodoferax aquaticus]|uniref:Uncharacterized protein n=1 Tax=Rhodoferax aquaticus TaxID=2527691 RepID=A0A515ERK3_9BURK|nr:hypothetical protein [Rhodoferax aquaticus]QDL55306.1 hypothetical protein EXZ61_14645 [Rhodoferax aquaticus]